MPDPIADQSRVTVVSHIDLGADGLGDLERSGATADAEGARLEEGAWFGTVPELAIDSASLIRARFAEGSLAVFALQSGPSALPLFSLGVDVGAGTAFATVAYEGPPSRSSIETVAIEPDRDYFLLAAPLDGGRFVGMLWPVDDPGDVGMAFEDEADPLDGTDLLATITSRAGAVTVVSATELDLDPNVFD